MTAEHMSEAERRAHARAMHAAALTKSWQVTANLLIGGYSLQVLGEPPVHEGGFELADFVTRDVGQHVAALHNVWLLLDNELGEPV